MKTLRQSGKILISLLFTLTIVFCCVCADSYATGHNSLTGFSAGVASITVSGGTVAQEVTPVISGDQYTYNIAITEDWNSLNSNKKITITFAKDLTHYPNCEISTNQPGVWPFRKKKVRDGATLVYEATIDQNNLNGSTVAYVYYDLENHVTSYKTYVFNVTINGALNPRILSNDTFMSIGDPDYQQTEPECDMKIVNDSDYKITYNGNRTDYYPEVFALYVDNASTLSVPSGYSDVISLSDITTGTQYTGYTVTHSAAAQLTVTKGGVSKTIVIPAPHPESASGSGAAPKSVISYLPIGQFATGTGWGTSGGSGTTATKFVGKSAPENTGVSLGALGGYIEFEFQNAIQNYAGNPYGVDFVVYGNAFNGNPEAGAVQVSADGLTWYELAGSKYYEDGFTTTNVASPKLYYGTKRNAIAKYQLSNSTLTAAIYDGTTALYPFASFGSEGWWPLTSEGYPMGTHTNTNANISVTHSNTAMEMTGVTAIEDSDDNAEYGYGYADVTPNGSYSAYGNPENPYIPYANGKTGGDGFDLDWAVNISTGMPVDISDLSIKYVRVYSSVLHIQPPFGETSAEVTGVFVTPQVEGRTDVDRTKVPTVTINDVNITSMATRQDIGNVRFYDISSQNIASGSTIKVTPNSSTTNANIFINNEHDDEILYNGSTYVRVLIQDGSKAPRIIVLKLK